MVKDERMKVGAKVWLRPFGNAARHSADIKTKEITRIGKRYFYCGDLKVEISIMKSIGFNSWYEVYFSEEEIKDVLEAERLKQSVKSFFSGYATPKLPLETWRTIHDLINQPCSTQ